MKLEQHMEFIEDMIEQFIQYPTRTQITMIIGAVGFVFMNILYIIVAIDTYNTSIVIGLFYTIIVIATYTFIYRIAKTLKEYHEWDANTGYFQKEVER